MYRLTYGKFAGMTLEHTILKSPSEVYARGGCAIRELERKPHLYELVREFRRLRKLLRRVKSTARCSEHGCKRRARSMTFEAVEVGRRLSSILVPSTRTD